MDKREEMEQEISRIAKELVSELEEHVDFSNDGRIMEKYMDEQYKRVEGVISRALSQARSQAYEDIAAYIEGKGGVIPGASVYAKVVSRNEMPAISGDDRDRLNKWDRHAFDRATEDLCRAIRKIGQEHNTP